ncbi:putative lipase [Nocardia nova SH22a]|uniref:Putative lipase n=1 Tax=Nocardia nova SH22a TaxID=1415166 RepID=W5TJW8_9NOCA|nr:lipase family protein [Nocardia nova]AHH19512.1 putative lipase [Nocardia nova SH22a]
MPSASGRAASSASDQAASSASDPSASTTPVPAAPTTSSPAAPNKSDQVAPSADPAAPTAPDPAAPASPDPAAPTSPEPSGSHNPGPSPFQRWLDDHIPAPSAVLPGIGSAASDPGALTDTQELWNRIQSSPTGDPFFDATPDNLAQYAPGDVIESRDVSWPGVPMVFLTVLTPVQRAIQLKFRTTNSSGAPSFGTATLLLPFGRWTGPGSRPVLLNAPPINALNRRCTPGYVFSHGYDLTSGNGNDFVPSPTMWAASRNYAVVIPDHEGPLMAYAEPTVAGHIMLDTVRAVRHLMPDQFGESRFAMTGYSGGAIASYAGAMLAREYAPELLPLLAGAAMGGLPSDYESFAKTFDGTYASGLMLTVTLALAREHPEILERMNHLAQWAAISPLKDVCSSTMADVGIFVPYAALANMADPLHTEFADEMFRRLSLKGKKAGMPIYVYNGLHDPWMPVANAEKFYAEQCALGVPATKSIVGGEHILGYFDGFLGSTQWLGERLSGVPAPNACEVAPRAETTPAQGSSSTTATTPTRAVKPSAAPGR